MKNKKFQIGIIGDTMVDDYGLIGVYLGLVKHLKDQGVRVTVIPSVDKKQSHINLKKIFNNFCNVQAKIPFRYYSLYKNNIEAFLIGCGPLWDYTQYAGIVSEIMGFGSFLSETDKKIAYSTTFKQDFPTTLIANPNLMGRQQLALKHFQGLGVASETDINILKDYYNCENAEYVIDPIFLPKREFWDSMVVNKKVNNNIVLYPLTHISRNNTVDNISNKLNIPNIKIATGDILKYNDLLNKTIVLDSIKCINPVEHKLDFNEWLEKISNCSYLVCGDYYSTCFAIIFKKNFVVFEDEMDTRISCFLNKIGLQDRMVKNYDEEKIIELFNTPINYDKTYELIDEFRTFSIEWLNNNLKKILS